MRKFHIITNTVKDPERSFERELSEYLEARGAVCTKDPAACPKDAGAVLVLGGDGTMLRAARDIAGEGIPMLGINLGTVGYLADTSRSEYRTAVDRLIADDYAVEERMLIRGELTKAGQSGPISADYALNDVAITRTGSLQILPFDVYVDGELLARYHADGVIISTPTGSTGYNLSAGGPIVEPTARCILLTPICPHTLSSRSIVLSPSAEITIVLGPPPEGAVLRAEADFDGRGVTNAMQPGDSIRVVRADRTAKIIRLSGGSFLDTLRRKIAT